MFKCFIFMFCFFIFKMPSFFSHSTFNSLNFLFNNIEKKKLIIRIKIIKTEMIKKGYII